MFYCMIFRNTGRRYCYCKNKGTGLENWQKTTIKPYQHIYSIGEGVEATTDDHLNELRVKMVNLKD